MSLYFHRTVSGMVTVSNMMAQVVRAKVKKSDPVSKVMYKQFKMVSRSVMFFILQRFRSNCEADQHLCFRYTDSTIPLLSKCKISSL